VSWERFQQHYLSWPTIGVALDVSAMTFPDDFYQLFHILEHAAANPDHRIARTPGETPFDARYAWSPPSSS
jgi:hypothetical protein